MRPFTFGLLPLSLLACQPTSGSTDTDADTDPTSPVGCIEVDGSGSFATIQAAVDSATDGATISLCEGSYEEEVNVTTAVTFAGSGEVIWTAPTNTAPLNISGEASVSISGVQFQSTRSGIVIEGGSLQLDGVAFTSIGNFAVKSVDSDVSATQIAIETPGDGGLEISGGTLTLSESTIVGATGYGVTLTDGAVGTLTNNAISETLLTTNEAFDGWAVHGDNATLILSGNTLSGNILGDVLVQGGGDLAMNGDILQGSYAGVWLQASTAGLTNVSITDYQQYGIVNEGGQTLSVTGTSIATSPEICNPQTDHDGFSGGFGIIALGTDLTISDTTVSGNTGAGIYQNPGNDTGVLFTLTNSTIADNARWGVIAFGSTMTFTDVSVTGTVDDDETCYDTDGYIVCNMAVSPWESDLTWNGGELSGNGTFGLTPIFASLDATDIIFQDNSGSGLWSYESNISCDSCTFNESREAGLYMQTNSVGTVTNSTFQNNSLTAAYTYVDEETDSVTETFSYYAGRDVEISNSHLTISDSEFVNGDMGVYAAFSDLDILNTTFEGYNSDAVFIYNNATEGSRLANTQMQNVGSSPIYCSGATLELNGVSVSDVNTENYKYETFIDGVLDYSYETTFNGTGVTASNCSLELKNSSITGVRGRALIASNSPLQIDDVAVSNAVQVGSNSDAAVYITYATTAPDAEIQELTIDGVTVGNGLFLSGNSTYAATQVLLTDISLGETSPIAGSGIVLSNLGTASITGFHAEQIGMDGISTTTTATTIDGISEDFDGQILSPGGNGIRAVNSATTIHNVTVVSPGLSGFNLGVGAHTVSDNHVDDASRYGMECDVSATFLECATNLVEGTLGALFGCGACESVQDTDTDATDTDATDTDL